MMKKITLLLALLVYSIGFSQTELLTNGDFASGTDSWVGTGPFSVVSGEAFFSSTNAGGNPWDTQLVQGSMAFVNVQEYTFTFYARAAADRNITVAIQNVGIWDDQFRQDFALTTVMTEYTATFNATSDNGNVQIGFLMAGTTSTDAVYYDDISIVTNGTVPETCNDGIMNNMETDVDCGGPNCSACAVPPTMAAPTPPNRPAADVVSLFSDAYTDITIDTFDTGWCPATTTTIMVAGNETNEVIGLGCEGVEFITDRFDATTFSFFHIDIWTTTATLDKSWNMKFSNWAGTGGEVNAIEFSTTNASSPALPNPNPGTWISLDIPLSSWTPGAREDLTQFIITSDLGTVYYDNLYLHRNTLGTKDFEIAGLNVYPNPSQNSWTVKTANVNMSSIKVFDILGKNVLSLSPNTSETAIDGSSLKSGLYFAQIKTEIGINSIKLIKN